MQQILDRENYEGMGMLGQSNLDTTFYDILSWKGNPGLIILVNSLKIGSLIDNIWRLKSWQ
jgi:hypothetical protein